MKDGNEIRDESGDVMIDENEGIDNGAPTEGAADVSVEEQLRGYNCEGVVVAVVDADILVALMTKWSDDKSMLFISVCGLRAMCAPCGLRDLGEKCVFMTSFTKGLEDISIRTHGRKSRGRWRTM